MNNKANGHSAAYLKRQAKNLKKQLGITHTEALDKAAINAGFKGWKNFLNNSVSKVAVKPVIKKSLKEMPKPSVISYHLMFSHTKYYRPNAQMSVAAHQELGAILKVVRSATENNRRASRAIKDVCFQLDEWAQKEHTDRTELPDNIFFDLYYGDNNTPVENSPSTERKTELQNLCRKAKSLLKINYHDCKPVRELLYKLDQTIKWIKDWTAAKKERVRNDKSIEPGSIIYFKSNKKPAVLISHNQYNGGIVCYADSGPVTIDRKNITVPKDQARSKEFKPMRLWLPYGKSNLTNGQQVLFNRDYIPLWTRLQNGKVVPASSDSRNGKSQDEFFFNDGSAP